MPQNALLQEKMSEKEGRRGCEAVENEHLRMNSEQSFAAVTLYGNVCSPACEHKTWVVCYMSRLSWMQHISEIF